MSYEERERQAWETVLSRPQCPKCGEKMQYYYGGDRCYYGPVCSTCKAAMILTGTGAYHAIAIPSDFWDNESGECGMHIGTAAVLGIPTFDLEPYH